MYLIDLMYLNSGDIVRGRYQIIDLLGRGGFGTTYKAEDNYRSANSPFVVVIKQIPLSQTANNEAVRKSYYIERLEQEANTLRDLEHPCIPKFFECFTENGYYYIVQEYIKGHDLSHEIKPGEPIEEAALSSLDVKNELSHFGILQLTQRANSIGGQSSYGIATSMVELRWLVMLP